MCAARFPATSHLGPTAFIAIVRIDPAVGRGFRAPPSAKNAEGWGTLLVGHEPKAGPAPKSHPHERNENCHPSRHSLDCEGPSVLMSCRAGNGLFGGVVPHWVFWRCSVNRNSLSRPFYFFFALSILSVGLLLHADPEPSDHSGALPSVQALDAENTAAGPVIHNLFGRFSWTHPMPPMCFKMKPHCYTGSNNPSECFLGKSAHSQCLITGCLTASICGVPVKYNDCCCSCTQTYKPCVGCEAVGYCS